MADIVVVVPGSQFHTYMDHKVDQLWIVVRDDFTWYPNDTKNSFNGQLPAPDLNLDDPFDAYGPFTATNAGEVFFDDIAPGQGKTRRKKEVKTAHSIIVT